MNKQFTRMQKLAGIITEGLYTTQMDQEAPIQSEATPNKMKKSEFKAKIKEMIKSDTPSEPVAEASLEGLDRMDGLAPTTAVKMLVDAAQRIIYSLKKEGFEDEDIHSYLSDLITTLPTDLSEAKKKEEDTEEEVDVKAPVAPEGEMDVTMDVPAGEDTTVDINGDGTGDIDAGSSEAKKAFGDLTDAFQAAKTLGDEKLIRQIANTITYFNKNIILKQG